MLTTKITNIANAIRAKTKTTEPMTLDEMPSKIENIETQTEPTLQDKTVEITENGTQTITPDEGYDALSSIEITTNAAEDLTEELNTYNTEIIEQKTDLTTIVDTLKFKALVGEVPSSGYIFSDYVNGYPTVLTIKGIESIPNFAVSRNGNNSYNTSSIICANIKKIVLDKNVKKLGQHAFSYLINLEEIDMPGVTTLGKQVFYGCKNLHKANVSENLVSVDWEVFTECDLTSFESPSGLTTLSDSLFYNNKNLALKTLPYIQVLGYTTFYYCYGIIQMSLPSIVNFGTGAASSGGGPFYNCKYMKAVWIGPNCTSFGNYIFQKCSALKYIFIDLPRATVEADPGYATKWSTNTVASECQIICRDDAGFKSCEEFDAVDWSTYTG